MAYNVWRPTPYAGAPLPLPEPETWRTGSYWIKLVDPPPWVTPQRRGDLWAQCRRCGVLSLVTLPADLGDALARMREICAVHERCPQTLQGARWELLVTLALRAKAAP